MTKDIQPSSKPPPLLNPAQLQQIREQGHLPLELNPKLLNILSDLSAAAAAFFERSLEEKCQAYPQLDGTELEYYEVPNEKEYVTLRHASASKFSENIAHGNAILENNAAELWKQTAMLMHRILGQISASLNIRLDAWDPVLDGCLLLPAKQADMTPTLLRMFKYLPSTGIAEEHRDLGLLTLCVGTGKGLQVWDASGAEGRWLDAEGPTILTGRTLAYLTNGRVPAALHRVVGNPQGRTSIVFALRPSIKNKVPLTPFGGWGALDGPEIWATVKDNVRNINATRDVQERQLKEQLHRMRQEQLSEKKRTGLLARFKKKIMRLSKSPNPGQKGDFCGAEEHAAAG